MAGKAPLEVRLASSQRIPFTHARQAPGHCRPRGNLQPRAYRLLQLNSLLDLFLGHAFGLPLLGALIARRRVDQS